MKVEKYHWTRRTAVATMSAAGLLAVLVLFAQAIPESRGEAGFGTVGSVSSTTATTPAPVPSAPALSIASEVILEVSLALRDTDDTAFTGDVEVLVRGEFTSDGYIEYAHVSNGLATIEFTLSDQDYTTLVEVGYSCDLLVFMEGARDLPLPGPGGYLVPSEGKAAILTGVPVSEVASSQETQLAATVVATLMLPPLYGTVVLTQPTRAGQSLDFVEIDSEGNPVHMAGPTEGFEFYQLAPGAGLSSIDLYSWSTEPAMGIDLFRENGRKAAATVILRRQGTALISNGEPFEVDVVIDRALHPTATKVVFFDGAGYTTTVPADILTALGRVARCKEAVVWRNMNTRSSVTVERNSGSYAIELWGLQQDPNTGLFSGQLLDYRAPVYFDQDALIEFD